MRSYWITTPRLGFAVWTPDDREAARALWCDPEVTRYIGRRPMTPAQADERLAAEIDRQAAYGMQYWPLFSLASGAFVGCCGLRPWDSEPGDTGAGVFVLGFHLLPAYWGQGYATEAARAVMNHAFTALHADGLYAGHHPDNDASAHVLQKLRFRRTRADYYPPTGLYHPAWRYARERIETDRLLLRPWQPSDAEPLARQANDVRIWNNVRDRFPHPYTRTDADTFIALVSGKRPPRDFAVVVGDETAGGIGYVSGTDGAHASAEIGYWLGEAYRGRGIMSEAVDLLAEHIFATTDIRRLVASVFAGNAASMRVLEKAGFRRIGIRCKAVVKDGHAIDLHDYERNR